MARANTRAGDHTGREKARLEEQHAAEQEAKARSLAMATADVANAPVSDETVPVIPPDPNAEDLSKGEGPKDIGGGVQVTDVAVSEPTKKFRVNENLEQVTLGAGNHYDFVQGQEYEAPTWIYDHLESKGLIWH